MNRLSLCNEVVRELPFARQCALAAAFGYDGLEIAPFTLGGEAYRMPAAERAQVRRTCADAGMIKATCWSRMKAAVKTASRGRRADALRLPLGDEVGTDLKILSWLECFAGRRPDP